MISLYILTLCIHIIMLPQDDFSVNNSIVDREKNRFILVFLIHIFLVKYYQQKYICDLQGLKANMCVDKYIV